MSMRGGYQIINLDNVPFNSEDMNPFTYRQMYYNLLNSNSKLIILSGLNMDGVKYADNDVVFYEVEGESDYPIFQAVLRLTWNQAKHTCTTRYINIQSAEEEPYSWKDAKVWLSADTIIYEDVDQALDIDSEKAIANKVVTANINRLDAEDKTFLKLDGSREMTGPLTIIGQRPKTADIMIKNGKSFKVTSDTGSYLIFDGVNNPTSEYHGANKKYVDDKIESITPPIYDETDISTNDVNNKAEFHSNGLMFSIRINVASSFTTCTFSINSQSIIDYYNTIKGTNEDSVSIRAMAISGAYDESNSFRNLTAECNIKFEKILTNTTITITETNYGATTSIRNYYITGFLY